MKRCGLWQGGVNQAGDHADKLVGVMTQHDRAPCAPVERQADSAHGWRCVDRLAHADAGVGA